MALPLGVEQGGFGFQTRFPVSPEIARAIVASRQRVNLLRGQGFLPEAEVFASPEELARAGVGMPLSARAALVGREVFLGTAPTFNPNPLGITRDAIRADGFLPQGDSVLGQLIQGGFGILQGFLQSKFGAPGLPAPGPGVGDITIQGPAITGGRPITLAGGAIVPAGQGSLLAAGGPIGLAAVTAALVAVGGRLVGTVIQITRAGWARIPSIIKSAAVALGFTLAFTDADLLGNGGGGFSMAQQRKIDRFQTLTTAGVPPGLAARAVGIGKKRRKGISAFELSGFRRISHLLAHVGMVPRGLRGARPRRGHHHHKA